MPFEHLLFLGRFVRNPARVGAILPSSARLARSMIDGLERTPGMRVAELGAGTGRITAEIARWLPEDGLALAIDIDPGFIERLTGRWSQVECVCEQAERLLDLVKDRGIGAFDHIVSGLPFASLPAATTQRILYAVQRALREGGTFTTFQYVHAWRFPSAVNFRRAASRRLGSDPVYKFVGANVPPAMVLRWRKTTQSSAAGRAAAGVEIERPH
jgi:phosphatidylethanolamine/phosphatidyl-N-methylethanolamine N-methyltransferase